jgi:hypothetical protein
VSINAKKQSVNASIQLALLQGEFFFLSQKNILGVINIFLTSSNKYNYEPKFDAYI